MVDFLFALIELVSITVYYGSRVMCTSIHPSLHSNFTWTGSSPSTILDIGKLETLGYPTLKTASLCVPSFWHNTGVRRTDGQTDRYAVAYTALAKLALWSALNTGYVGLCHKLVLNVIPLIIVKLSADHIVRPSVWIPGTLLEKRTMRQKVY